MGAIAGHYGLMLAGTSSPGLPRYWRINITAADGGTAISIHEIEMRATPGGADQCTGGTPLASSRFDVARDWGYAFDNVTTLSSNFWGSAAGTSQWIQYQLPVGMTINEVTIQARNASGGDTFGQSPKDFDIQSSTDGTTFTTEWSVTGSTGWTAGLTRTFTRP